MVPNIINSSANCSREARSTEREHYIGNVVDPVGTCQLFTAKTRLLLYLKEPYCRSNTLHTFPHGRLLPSLRYRYRDVAERAIQTSAHYHSRLCSGNLYCHDAYPCVSLRGKVLLITFAEGGALNLSDLDGKAPGEGSSACHHG